MCPDQPVALLLGWCSRQKQHEINSIGWFSLSITCVAGAAGASITAYWLAQPVDIGWCKRYINNKCFGLSN